MAKRDRTLEVLNGLSAARRAEGDVDATLRAGLSHAAAVVIEKAADVAVDRRAAGLPVGDLADALADALGRLLRGGAKGQADDAGQRLAVVRAMAALEQEHAETLHATARGVEYRRALGGELYEQTATLRAESAAALVRLGDAGVMPLLAETLFRRPPARPDEVYLDDPVARLAAAQGLGYTRHPSAALLLRAKLAEDNDAPAVLGEAAGALLRLREDDARGLAEDWLRAADPDRLAAAVLPVVEADASAVGLLLGRWPAVEGTREAADFLYGVAAARGEEAAAFLRSVVATGERDAARAARAAVAELSRDPALREAVEAAANARGL